MSTCPSTTRTTTATTDRLAVARAEAIFTSPLTTGTVPDRGQVQACINSAVVRHGGVGGCAVEVAGDYGEYPETAARRMRWALGVVSATYGRPDRRHGR